MERIKRYRRPFRVQLTRSINDLAQLLDQEEAIEIQAKLEGVISDYQLLEEWDRKVITAVLEDETQTDDAQDREFALVDEYRHKFKIIKIRAEKFLSQAQRETVVETGQSGRQINNNIKYPKISIKTFGGDLKEWLGWWAQFKQIHEDPQLTTADKFQYLVQSMVKNSKAYMVVSSYPQSNENYDKAVEAIKQRFGKENILVEVYVRELLKLVINNNRENYNKINLSKMYDVLESHLRALESLGVTSDKYAAMLYPLVESSAWQRSSFASKVTSRGDNAEHRTKSRLDSLIEFLQSEVENEERIILARDRFDNTTKEISKQSETEESVPTAVGLHVGTEKNNGCVFCNRQHDSDRCVKAQSMTLTDRKARVEDNKCCFTCLKRGHVAKRCKAFVKCHVCGKRHFVILCPLIPTKEVESATDETTPPIEAGSALVATNCVDSEKVLLQTVLVNVVGEFGKKTARVLFDSGAQRSYIVESLASSLKLKKIGDEFLQQAVFGGNISQTESHARYQFEIESLDGRTRLNVKALGQNKICGTVPKLAGGPWLIETRLICHILIYYNDMKSHCPEIEILIGADLYGVFLTGKSYQLKCGLTAFQTIVGWTIIGAIPTRKTENSLAMTVTNLYVSDSSIAELWKLETIGISDPIENSSKEEIEKFSQEHFTKTVHVTDEGRYEINLPWVIDKSLVPDNKQIAMRRLESTTRKLISMSRYKDYDEVFQQWLEMGIIEIIPKKEWELQGHYLPHRPVFKVESQTTPVRPVFDASCKTKQSYSLNDCLEKGPNLLELIPAMILRFREKKIGVIADIKKAFLTIGVTKEDRNYLRFLWWDSQESRCLLEYRHCRVVFGVNCSPFLLAAVIKFHLSKAPINLKDSADHLVNSFYVDNVVTSVDTKSDLETFRAESIDLLNNAKMELRAWEHTELDDNLEQSEQSRITNVLGLKWDKKLDVLSCDFNEVNENINTKRTLLSVIQRIFDPIGFLAPATLIPKLLLQETWVTKINWDAELPTEIREKFYTWASQVEVLKQVKIPRRFTNSNIGTSWSLHVFCDASQKAYATAVFLRTHSDEGTHVHLLQAKSRVAPLKKATIPRLELMSCVIGVRLAESIKRGLKFPDIPTTYWSDSTTVISWIKRPTNWNVFVTNRVTEISKNSNTRQWRYVPSECNPADLPSRDARQTA